MNYSVSGLVGFIIAIMILSTSAVVLRFWSRLLAARITLGWDDWLALAALPVSLAQMSVVLRGASSGLLGKHIPELTLPELEWSLKLLVAANLLFNVSISFSRLSALAFYSRVFTLPGANSKLWTWSFWIVTSLCIAWPLAMIPMNLFNCSPVRRLWQPWLPGHCMTQFEIYMISGATSVFVDLCVLILPLPKIYLLHMDLRKRFMVGLAFLAGYSVIFMSVGRMIQTAQVGSALDMDPIYTIIPMAYWIEAECGLSILAICLPAIFQLAKRVYRSGLVSLLSSKDFSALEYEMNSGKSRHTDSKRQFSQTSHERIMTPTSDV
ncbi:uncharacterized protein LY89DRAFT_781852 [Mollisia scopiformis]|uniref:Rhodopsin domain-containing protein n=1 Tax=Mollisia scopiformis TaxID=149040 RepID=A0A194XC04_MOLSC|nr:uncharacterized protein LY89DRAFT_781852 [Mollisia scopiformis]KUJ17703.1 hypothetical protein LY89DRAFT_781852 [Mollisia scopiformis]